MKIIAIIQARMGSSRLPGKVMADICGKPLIDYVVERVALSTVQQVVVACPEDEYPNIINHAVMKGWDWCAACEPNDVAGRFASVLETYPCDAFVRVCADSPLIDPKTIGRAICGFGDYKLFTTPCGSAEMVNTAKFLKQVPEMGPYNREHVTTYWRSTWETPLATGMPKLTVDTQADLDRVRGVVSRMTKPHTEYGWRECLSLV